MSTGAFNPLSIEKEELMLTPSNLNQLNGFFAKFLAFLEKNPLLSLSLFAMFITALTLFVLLRVIEKL
jgi:hypothetical protein